MKSVGGMKLPNYPAGTSELPVTPSRVQTSSAHQTPSSPLPAEPAPTLRGETPGLAKIRHYAAGRYEHLAQVVSGMEFDEQGKSRQSTREKKPEGEVAMRENSAVASTSRQGGIPATKASFRADSLAELASWSENTHSYRAEPAAIFGRGAKMPPGTVKNMLSRARQEMEAGLKKNGLTLQDAGAKLSDQHIDVNLNYLEMKQYVNSNAYWFPIDHNHCGNALANKANLYFSHIHALNTPPLPPLSPVKSKNEAGLLQALLHDSPGLVVGEVHSSVASKRTLIKNMKELQRAGVTTLYMEHLCEDSHGEALRAYLRSPKGSPMPARLKGYLDMQTRGNLPPHKKVSEYNFTSLLMAAKENGLNVIPIDTAETYLTSKAGGNQRIKVMNYYAAEKIRLSQPAGKWLAFVGSGHATTNEGVPGLAELHGVRSLIIDDHGKNSKPEININVKNYAGQINPDATLSLKV